MALRPDDLAENHVFGFGLLVCLVAGLFAVGLFLLRQRSYAGLAGLCSVIGFVVMVANAPTPDPPADTAPRPAPAPTRAVAHRDPPACIDFHRAAHDARSAASASAATDADRLYQVATGLYDADQQFQSCMDASPSDSVRYDALVDDGDVLLTEGAIFSLYLRAGGVYPGDPGGRDTRILRTLAVKQLQLVANDAPAPQRDRRRARSLLQGVGER